MALFALGELVAAASIALALVLPVWAAVLIIGGAILLVAGLLMATGLGRIKRASPLLPAQAIASIKRDFHTVKGSVKR
jgi:sulfite exporter TauE/SafE